MQNQLITETESIQRYYPRKPPASEDFSETVERFLIEQEKLVCASKSLSWNLGFATRCGNVRKRNEDYGTAFNRRGHQVIIMGDGLGGLPEGHLASYLAVESVKQVVLEKIVAGMGFLELKKISSDALWATSHVLALMGDKLNLTETGLRTTLIMLIANKELAVLTYIGDGAVYHYKSPRDCKPILSAQKVSPGSLNLLSASLGPTPHGKAHSRVVTRSESDAFIIVTDGMADRIDSSDDNEHAPLLIQEVIDRAVGLEGDLQTVTVEAVDAWTKMQDDKGFICDDNVSLGIVGNYSAPVLYASSDSEQETAGISEDADTGQR